jgi:uncharacterized protein (TIGR02099 family)
LPAIPSPPPAAVRARPALRAVLVWGGRLLLLAYFAAASLILVGRHFVLPEIAGQRERIERELSAAIGLPVKIGVLSAEWPGLHPRLAIEGLQIHDRAGRPALGFDRVVAEVGWSSLWRFGLYLHRLEIDAPALDVRRDSAGALFVAGLPVKSDGEGGFADWLLAQGRIVVRDASLNWHDELRGAPPLALSHLSLDLRNAGRHHSFGLVAEPDARLASRLDLRGNLQGDDPAKLADWAGELHVDVEQVDLAAWTPWLDAPLELKRGSGGLRLWLSFENLLPTGITADLRLADVAVRLRPDLPALDLGHLHGRLIARGGAKGYVGEIRRLELATHDGIEVAPTDARLQLDIGGRREGGEFHANGLDLGALAALAGRLPLPPEVHQRLKDFAPRGRLADLQLSWRGPVEAPARWRVKGRFDGLALAAHQELPGFAGLSGSLEGDERAGTVRLDSKDMKISLPAVFPEPTLTLASLTAETGWQARDGEMDLLLSRLAFQNHDAHGEVVGRYRYTGQGPGEIDLTAKLTNAAGNAVWRYLPLVVNKDARDWLRAGIVGGRSDSTTLRLKGPLAQFPFRDGKGGIFQVKGGIQGATLNFAPGWPQMTEIDGDLLFEGVRMTIRGQRGKIMGVALSEVRAEIPDLEVPEEVLHVSGNAHGTTQQFLDFIEASPVGARIDHFTQPMGAAGKGDLDLRLTMPLRHLVDTQVQGRYRFADNHLRVLPELPPFTAAQGEFHFTADRLQAKNLRARLFGAPLALEVASAPGGAVKIAAAGTLTAQALRQEYGLRAFEHLSGETAWRASVTVKKPGAEVRVESSLEGLSSSLPEPFNKSVREAMPLKLDGRIDPRGDSWNGSLGGGLALRLAQAGENWRGRVAVGKDALKSGVALPPRGVTLAIAQPVIDADAWRALLAGNGNGKASAAIPLDAIELRGATLRLLDRDFHDVRLNATRADARWRFAIDSREAQGQLNWDGAGAGRIAGRLARLALPASDRKADAAEPADGTRELPAIDLTIDDFRVHDRALGELRIAAENREAAWQAKLEMKNEAARLTGEGRWRPSATAPETALDFKLDVSDAEKLLGRLGQPDAVRRGAARLEGRLAWAGAPFALDLESLSGQLRLDAEKGQFKKLEPGVGRLLGVLSLQSLPRRITLDFRDIFSEGFAYDSIAGAASIDRGMMRTDNLRIRGPAAKVALSGQVNLVAETQDLKVRVQPSVGESIAVGVMIAHPVAGAVAWVAQKVLDDPLDQAFAYEYAVTGGWSEPKVEKLAGKPPAETKAPPP